MLEKKYKLSSFLEIQHSFDGDYKKAHAHTIAIECTIKTTNDMINYHLVEKAIGRCIDKYNHKYLNVLPELQGNATIENLGEALCYDIDDELQKIGYEMDRFEIGETPIRTYIITNELRD